MIKIDPEFKKLIPALTGEEFTQLEKNIISEGCRERLIVWAGHSLLIDGHNRYDICTNNNIRYEVMEKHFESRTEVIQWIILNQFGRRNLSPYDRSVLALRYEDEIKVKGLQNKITAASLTNAKLSKTPLLVGKTKAPLIPVNTREEVAKKAEVSSSTIHKVKYLEEKAAPEVKDRVRSGDLTINAAYNLERHKEKQEQGIDYGASLDRRIAIYPPLNRFKILVAMAFEQITGKGKMAEELLGRQIDSLSEEKRNKLVAIFNTMTPEQIERTADLKRRD